MNKAGLSAAVAEKLDISKKDADALLQAVLDTITQTLAEGEKVQLVGFGVFETKQRRLRGSAANGQEEQETTALQFRPGKYLKEAIGRRGE